MPSKSAWSSLLIGHLRAGPKDAEAQSKIRSAATVRDAVRFLFLLLQSFLRFESQARTSAVVGSAVARLSSSSSL